MIVEVIIDAMPQNFSDCPDFVPGRRLASSADIVRRQRLFHDDCAISLPASDRQWLILSSRSDGPVALHWRQGMGEKPGE